MKTIIKFLSGITIFCLIVVPYFCPTMRIKALPTTEYYSEDILKDIPVSTENVATDSLKIEAKAALLMEVNTGKVLYSYNEKERLAPASITKIMSLLLVVEAIEDKKLTLDTKVAASEYAASMGGSQIWLEPNEEMTVDELLRASVIASANDATVALAEAVAGSEEAFVVLMNKKAKELKMLNTNFVNSCGLDADNHLTTALDIGIMAAELIKHDIIKKYSTVWMDALRDGQSELVNTNKLIRYYNGATGLKTGTTSKAGCSVAATAERDGLELVAVVMGSATSSERFAGAKKLLDYGFANYSFKNVYPSLQKDLKILVKNGMADYVTPICKGSIKLLDNKGSKEITQIVELPEEITAPVNKGDIIGKIKFLKEKEQVGELLIYAGNSVQKSDFLNVLSALMKALLIP